eukprot:jgi/Tetstr1/431405/TSEL_021095.t1
MQRASWLHDAAEVNRVDWFHLTSLVLLSRALTHRDTIARLTEADRTACFDYTGRILRLLEDDSAAHCTAAQVNGRRCPYRSSNGLPYCKRHSNHGLPLLAHIDDGATGHGRSDVCFGCGQPSDNHFSDEEADCVYTFACTTTCAACIAAACAAGAPEADLPSAARPQLGPRPRAPAAHEPAAPAPPFTLTSADYNKLVEPVAALTGKVDQVIKENRTLRAQAQAGAPRAVPPAGPKPPPEAALSSYTTPAELLSSTCATTHRWGNAACRAYIESYQGSKDHLDACGRPVRSPMHYANRAYGAQLDLLAAKPTADKARQWHELHGYQPPANPSQPHPDRHHLEAYHVNMLTWHWELLHVVDSPLFHKSSDGERHVETIMSVTSRIRFMHAVQRLCEHGDGGPAMSWPSVCAYMQRSTARSWSLESCPRRTNPNPAPWGPKACAYHLGDHRTSQHPAEEPITQPWPKFYPFSSPLSALLLRKFGIDHALLIVRTFAAANVHIHAAYADLGGSDSRPI